MKLRALLSLLAAIPGLSLGHAVVTPSDSAGDGTQQYTLHVPNEKDVPTIAVQLSFPSEIDVTTVDERDGWTLVVKRDAKGRVSLATWSGALAPKANVQFTFTAHNPAAPATVAWNVTQTYEGNLVVEWTGAPGSRTPASRTTIH